MRAPQLNPDAFETLYRLYLDPAYARGDPLEVLYRYPRNQDREVVGLLAAGLAYGNVKAILASLNRALEPMGPEPARWLEEAAPRDVRRAFRGFYHRWTRGDEVARVLLGLRAMRRQHGSAGACFQAVGEVGDASVLPGLERWVQTVGGRDHRANSLLAAPSGGSACKRMLLYLRWMLRRDAVDPGCWVFNGSAGRLVAPVDVHMHRLGLALGFTRKRQANLAAALEITEGFRSLCPADPVRYDFALTRLFILNEPQRYAWLEALRGRGPVPQ